MTGVAVLPVATVAWLGVGTGAALAASGGNATAANANGGVGQDKGAGNAKHDVTQAPAVTDTSTAASGATSTTTATVATTTTGTSAKASQSKAPVKKAATTTGSCPGGPYCSPGSGGASGNGGGNGKAVGKPCAGCVGNADNKNPKGQNPGGGDHNKGYECDGNNGIAKTNPAHTGCTPPTPPTDTCPAGEHLSNGTCVPDDDCVPSAANNNCHETTPCAAPAHAGPDGTCVLGEKHTRKPGTTTPGTAVLGTKVTRLPFTGVEAGWMVEAGIGAVALGTLMLIVGGRRRRQLV